MTRAKKEITLHELFEAAKYNGSADFLPIELVERLSHGHHEALSRIAKTNSSASVSSKHKVAEKGDTS